MCIKPCKVCPYAVKCGMATPVNQKRELLMKAKVVQHV